MLERLLKFLPVPKIEGYEHPDLVEAIFRKTVAFRPTEDWPEMHGAQTVLDFGGGCGAHYRQARSSAVGWAVVETPAMVARARQLETDNLRFFTEIEPATTWLGAIDVMHSNGALHYTPEPESMLAQLCSIGARKLLWYRLYLTEGAAAKERQISRLRDNGPNTVRVKRAALSCDRTSMPEAAFLKHHHAYSLEARGLDWFRFVR